MFACLHIENKTYKIFYWPDIEVKLFWKEFVAIFWRPSVVLA